MTDVILDGSPAASAPPAAYPDAGAPRRFLARLFDMWLAMVALGFVVSLSMMILSPALLSWLETPRGAQLFALACMPLVFLIDAAVLARFGNTPGKALLRLRVVTIEGAALGWGQAARRNLHMWVAGLGLTIPLVNLITISWQGWRVAHGKPASYDEGKYRVVALPMGWGRRLAFALLLFFIFATVVTVGRMAAPPAREAPARAVTTWTNPENGRTVAIASFWGHDVTVRDGVQVHVFMLKSGTAVMLAAIPVRDTSLADFVDRERTAMAGKFALSGRFESFHGSPSWTASGARTNGEGTLLEMRIVQQGQTFWRMSTFKEPPHAPNDKRPELLRDDLWSTIVAK